MIVVINKKKKLGIYDAAGNVLNIRNYRNYRFNFWIFTKFCKLRVRKRRLSLQAIVSPRKAIGICGSRASMQPQVRSNRCRCRGSNRQLDSPRCMCAYYDFFRNQFPFSRSPCFSFEYSYAPIYSFRCTYALLGKHVPSFIVHIWNIDDNNDGLDLALQVPSQFLVA